MNEEMWQKWEKNTAEIYRVYKKGKK